MGFSRNLLDRKVPFMYIIKINSRLFRSSFLLITLIYVFSCSFLSEKEDKNWPVYLGDNSSSQYSTLDQITIDNVQDLEVAWIYQSGDSDSLNRTQIQCNPLIIDGILYGSSPKLKFFALNAATGEEQWVFDPWEGAYDQYFMGVNRGLVYWTNGDQSRLLFTAGSFLYALDPVAGKRITAFGENGTVDLRNGLGRDASDRFVISTTPGIVYKDLLILGTRVDEGSGAAPGHIRAYNVITGEQEWIFHTIPQPGEFGYDTWPEEAYLYAGGANAWAGMSLDEERGLVFIPTGSASYDFYGADRHGENLFANCILALNANTGERIWHFQTVHHDLWDRDIPAPPNLVTIKIGGRKTDAVAQITKTGYVFVLDRESGEPLFPIEEEPVPASRLYGEKSWATQPKPLKPPPFARQKFERADLNNMDSASYAFVSERFTGKRNEHMYAPPSEEGTIIFPGYDGGGEWGGAAYDPETGWLYVNANEMPWILNMVPIFKNETNRFGFGKGLFRQYCASCHGVDRKGGEFMGVVPTLGGLTGRMNRESFMTQLEQGKGNMPSFAWLTGYEGEAIRDYLWLADSVDDTRDESNLYPDRYAGTGYIKFKDPEGYPAITPPWGTLTAIDLSAGEIQWQVSLGEHPGLTEKGIPVTGTENYGGPLLTAGGILFIAATQDEKFRAFDPANGNLVWETKLPAAGYATPSTYSINGKQYIVIACGGGKLGTPSGDVYMAFALPGK